MDILDKYHLKEWWLQALTPSQREQIANNYGIYQNVDNTYFSDGAGKLGLLITLSNIALPPAKEILKTKAESELFQCYKSTNSNLIDMHLALASLIKHYYSLRANLEHYEKAKELCKMQIALASQTAAKFKHPKPPDNGINLDNLREVLGHNLPYYDEPQMLPSHTGYKQLAIILEKEGDIEGALRLSKQALKQGWTDNYEKRIDKLTHKLAKKQIAKK